MEEMWFVDTPMWIETTISQFIDAIEGNENWSDSDKKTFAMSHLKGAADIFAKEHLQIDMDWDTIKLKLFEQFKCQVNIWDKVEMRRNLVQGPNETMRDFYNRCVSFQYILCDDYGETVMDNDIMINFMHGMHRDIFNILYEQLFTSEHVVDLNLCLGEAEVIESKMNQGIIARIAPPVEEVQGYTTDPIVKHEPQGTGMAAAPKPVVSNPNMRPPIKKMKKAVTSEHSPIKKVNPTFKKERSQMPSSFGNTAVPITAPPPTPIPDPIDKNNPKCPACGKEFSSVGNMKRHYKNDHAVMEPTPCTICKMEFRNESAYDTHLKKVHEVTRREINAAKRLPMDNQDFLLAISDKCVVCFGAAGTCNTKFSSIGNAKRHYKSAHQGIKQPTPTKKPKEPKEPKVPKVKSENQTFKMENPIVGTFVNVAPSPMMASYNAVPSNMANPITAPSTMANYNAAPSTMANYNAAPSTMANYNTAPSTMANYNVAPSTMANVIAAPNTMANFNVAPSNMANYNAYHTGYN